MLNAISWQQYLTAVLLLNLAWYAYIGLRYYREELSAWLKIRPQAQTFLPAVAHKQTDVMGEARPDADTALYYPEELLFAGTDPDDISDQTLPKGPSDDLLAEAMVLIAAYSENLNKSEFLSLFKLLLDKYEVFADEISLPAVIKSISVFAATKLPFEIQAAEWPLTFTP